MSAEVGANETVDVRPVGITDKQDAIIQHVAEFVVNSCDSAKYQHKLRTMTKHNAYFNFLDPSHAYYTYYEYLLQSYRYWKEVEAAAKASGGTAAMMANMNNNTLYDTLDNNTSNAYDGNGYQAEYGYYNNDYYNYQYDNSNVPSGYAPPPEEYIQGEMYNYNDRFQSTDNYHHPSWHNSNTLDRANKTLYPPSAAPPEEQQQEYNNYYSTNDTSYINAPSSYQAGGYYDENATVAGAGGAASLSNMYANTVFTPSTVRYDHTASKVDVTQYALESAYNQQQQQQQLQVQPIQTEVEQHDLEKEEEEQHEEDEDEEYEMIIENDVQKLVPRRR